MNTPKMRLKPTNTLGDLPASPSRGPERVSLCKTPCWSRRQETLALLDQSGNSYTSQVDGQRSALWHT